MKRLTKLDETKKRKISAMLNRRAKRDRVEMGLSGGQAFCIHYGIPTKGRR